MQLDEHLNVPPREYPSDLHVLPPKSNASQSSLIWFLTESPHFGGGGKATQLAVLNVQSPLHDNVPLAYPNDWHDFPSKDVLSHSSLKPGVFGFSTRELPQNFAWGLEQPVASNLHVDKQLRAP